MENEHEISFDSSIDPVSSYIGMSNELKAINALNGKYMRFDAW